MKYNVVIDGQVSYAIELDQEWVKPDSSVSLILPDGATLELAQQNSKFKEIPELIQIKLNNLINVLIAKGVLTAKDLV